MSQRHVHIVYRSDKGYVMQDIYMHVHKTYYVHSITTFWVQNMCTISGGGCCTLDTGWKHATGTYSANKPSVCQLIVCWHQKSNDLMYRSENYWVKSLSERVSSFFESQLLMASSPIEVILLLLPLHEPLLYASSLVLACHSCKS